MSRRKYSHPAPLTLAISTALAVSTTQAAVITVDTNADPGNAETCSLRSAIASVNTLSAVDGCAAPSYGQSNAIVFDAGVTGSIELTESVLTISEPVTISGPGANQLRIDAQGNSGVFAIENAGQVTISGLTITGGYANYGGGIYLYGYSALDLADCVISNNAAVYGGGVFQYAFGLDIDNCEITENHGERLGGGVAVSLGQASVRNSTISDNAAYEIGGGLWVEGLRFEGDDLDNPGPFATPRGAYGIQPSLNVASSVITGNQALFGGGIGAGRVDRPSLGPVATGLPLNGRGGFPPDPEPNLIVSESVVSNNQAFYGGGVGAWGFYVEDDDIIFNRGYDVGYGLRNDIEIEQSTIEGNFAVAGGGVSTKYTDTVLMDTHVVNNEAVELGGGILNLGNRLTPGGISANADRGLLALPFKYLGVYGGSIAGNQVGVDYDNGGLGRGLGGTSIGGGVANIQATTVLSQTEVTNNTGAEFGGGVATVAGASFLTFSHISGNEGGGLLSFYDSVSGLVYSRVESNLHQGGMICENGGICNAKYSSISENEGPFVGGVAANLNLFYGALVTQPPLFDRGQMRGFVSTSVYLGNATVSSNLGGEVGGLAGTHIELTYATIANNQQVGSLNTASQTRGFPRTGGLMLLTSDNYFINHTILAGNASDDQFGANDLWFPGANPIQMSFSLVQDDEGITATGNGNILGQDPLLGPLDFNGSAFSKTHALLENSPAIDAGDASLAPELLPQFDQRGSGFPRLFNDIIDIGAYEFIVDTIFADRFKSPPM